MEVSIAAVQIGHIAEVVAALVEQLDALDLAGAQRVSRTWAYEIRRSRICQERLFFIPGARREILKHVDTDPESRQISLMLRKWNEEDGVPDGSTFDRIVVDVHPLLHAFQHDAEYSSPRRLMLLFNDTERLLSLPAGKWQDMFITQPPVTQAAWEVQYTFDEGPFLHRPGHVSYGSVIHEQEGIRFYHILPELKKIAYPSSSEFWSWLPDEYENTRLSHKISIDDYITSYGFPQNYGTIIHIRGHVSAMDEEVVTASTSSEQLSQNNGEARRYRSHLDTERSL